MITTTSGYTHRIRSMCLEPNMLAVQYQLRTYRSDKKCNLLFFHYSIPEPTPSTMTALHQFGAEMVKLSQGLESVTAFVPLKPSIVPIEHKISTVVR